MTLVRAFLPVASIFFGCIFPLAAAYGFGLVCLRGLPTPRVIILAAGTVVESLAVYGLAAGGWVNRWSLAGLGIAGLIP